MATFRINLIRDYTPPPETRRMIFMGMVMYLAVCGVILVFLSYRGARRLVAANGMRTQIGVLENQFCREHPGRNNILVYGRELKQQMDEFAGKLATINAVCDQRVDLARILLCLSAPLPKDVNVASVDLDREKGAVEFEVAFLVGERGEAVDASQLIAVWNSDSALMARVGKISSMRSERRKMEGKALDVWRFGCALRGKEA
jgi:hypothetical protein